MSLDTSAATFSAGGLRFSGHETFALRYAWLPKAVKSLADNPELFLDEDDAMVELGIGKNMVRSLRFWVEATGLAEPRSRGMDLTSLAHDVFGDNGRDPFLEDNRTLWLLHWQIASRSKASLFAWRWLLNMWPFPELTRSEALASFQRESSRLGHSHSEVTLSQHLDIFLHTYCPSASRSVGAEDSLDGPFVELRLLQPVGQRRGDTGRWETVYAFRREPKPEITDGLFDYCLLDFWDRFHRGEETLTLREVTSGLCSPGQIFKLPDEDIRARLERLGSERSTRGYGYHSSAVQGLLSRHTGAVSPTLESVYGGSLS